MSQSISNIDTINAAGGGTLTVNGTLASTGTPTNPDDVVTKDYGDTYYFGTTTNYTKTQMAIEGSYNASSGKADFLKNTGNSVYLDASSGSPVSFLFGSGFAATGKISRFYRFTSIQNPTEWASLADGTYYFYVDYNSGTPTFGKHTVRHKWSTIAPSTPATNDGYFNINESVEYYYNAGWIAIERYYVGQATVSGGTVTDIRTYALHGRYDSGWFPVAAVTNYTDYHEIGVALAEGVRTDFYFSLDSAGADSNIAHDYMETSAGNRRGYFMRENVASANTHLYCKFGFEEHTQFYRNSLQTAGYFRILAERNF